MHNNSTPFESQDLNKIIEGDCLTVLRTFTAETIDLTITSPPYNKRNKTNGWLVNNQKYSHFDDHMPEEEYQQWQINILDELYRVTKPGGSLFYNHKIRWHEGLMIHPLTWLAKSQWSLKQEIVWDRGLAANMRGWRFWQVDERIYWLHKPLAGNFIGVELESKHAKMSSIWRIKPAPRQEEHPAPFPLEIPTRIIYSICKKNNSIILDPFSGTGTALVAAKLLGHKYIGIDVSPNYIEYAQQRIDNAEDEIDALTEEIGKHVIDDPFINRKKRGTISWPYGPTK